MKKLLLAALIVMAGCATMGHEAPPIVDRETIQRAPAQRGGHRDKWIEDLYRYCFEQKDMLQCLINNGIAI